MKRSRTLAIALGLSLLVAAAATAQPFGGFGSAQSALPESTLTGRISLTEDEAPTLTVGSTEYTLHIAGALIGEIEVANRDTVTVTGYVVERPRRDLLGSESIMMVGTFAAGGREWIAPQTGRGMTGQFGRSGGPAGMAQRGRGVQSMQNQGFGRTGRPR